MEEIRLTTLSHGSGCGCKIGRKDLSLIIKHLPAPEDMNVLVGTETADDAAVYRIDDRMALVQTVDLFTPVVDDPYDYGRIVSANAVSDIYAMGGRPLFALSIIAFPVNRLPSSILKGIISGGVEKAKEAGVEIIGGHSIDDPEPKYGLCVTGIVDQDKIVQNNKAVAGDLLILTKPIGTGIISRAIKAGKAAEDDIRKAVDVMTFLNKGASEAMIEAGISTATDVTGFGLLGHLYGMLKASGVGARIRCSSIPTIQSVFRYAKEGYIPEGTRRNLDYIEDGVIWEPSVPEEFKHILADAQTSGGLLISCPADKKGMLLELLYRKGCIVVEEIGHITDDKDCRIRVDY